jgi:hypothetical protein
MGSSGWTDTRLTLSSLLIDGKRVESDNGRLFYPS